jgi:hypothetical protein
LIELIAQLNHVDRSNFLNESIRKLSSGSRNGDNSPAVPAGSNLGSDTEGTESDSTQPGPGATKRVTLGSENDDDSTAVPTGSNLGSDTEGAESDYAQPGPGTAKRKSKTGVLSSRQLKRRKAESTNAPGVVNISRSIRLPPLVMETDEHIWEAMFTAVCSHISPTVPSLTTI